MLPLLECAPLAVGYHFFYRFAGIRQERLWPMLARLLYVFTGVMFGLQLAAGLFLLQGRDQAIALYYRYPVFLINTLSSASQLYFWVPLAMCAAIARGFLVNRDADHRRRLRWVAIAVVAGLAPLVIDGALVYLHLGHLFRTAAHRNAFLILIPISMAYAVVKHEVLGVRVVVRQGIRYLFARNVLYAALLLPTAGLILPILLHPDRSIVEIASANPVYLNLSLVAAASLGLKYRRPLGTWIDRKFFREAYREEQILRSLIDMVAREHSLTEIACIVSTQVDAALHPRWIRVFYREGGIERINARLLLSELARPADAGAARAAPATGRVTDGPGRAIHRASSGRARMARSFANTPGDSNCRQPSACRWFAAARRKEIRRTVWSG